MFAGSTLIVVTFDKFPDANKLSGRVSTFSPMFNVVKLVQFPNAVLPIVVISD